MKHAEEKLNEVVPTEKELGKFVDGNLYPPVSWDALRDANDQPHRQSQKACHNQETKSSNRSLVHKRDHNNIHTFASKFERNG